MRFIIRRVLIPLVILGGLFIGGNIWVRDIAADRIAQAAQTSFDLAEKPEVHLEGFPIIVRALTGNLPGLSFEAHEVQIEGLVFREVIVRMRDVNAQGGLLRSGGLEVVIRRGEVRAEATDEAVNAFLEEREEDATIAFMPNGRARVRTVQRFAGSRRRIVAVGTVELLETRQRLRFMPEEITVDGEEPNARIRREAQRRARLVVDLPRLPGNLRITTLQTGEGFVALAAILEDYRFPPPDDEDLDEG